MKSFRIFYLILALLFLLSFSFTACDNGLIGGGGKFANTNWRTSYSLGGLPTQEMRLSFITSEDWAVYTNYGSTVEWQLFAGSYTVSGGKATLCYIGLEYGKATISGNTLTMLGMLATYGSSWTRE